MPPPHSKRRVVAPRSAMRRLAVIVGPLLVVGLWWFMSASGGEARSYYLPPPPAVVAAAVQGFADGSLLEGALATLAHFLGGFTAAVAIGLAAGLALGRFEAVGTALQPVLNFLRTLPGIAILPVLMLLLGLGNATIIATSTFASVWFVLLNTAAGVQEVHPVVLDTGRVFGAQGWRRWVSVVLPSAAPRIATGVRLALGISLVVAVSAEIIMGRAGLGFIIADSMETLRPSAAYAAILTVGVLAWIVFQVGEFLEAKVLPWANRSDVRRA